MTTYRERREARVEQLRIWAEKREVKSEAAFGGAQQIMDMIPMGQPILVGHHSERRHRRDVDRIERGMRAGIDNARKATEFASRSANIEAAAGRAIYSDDDDAIERLRERIASLEAERETLKAKNREIRKALKDAPDDEWPARLAAIGCADALAPFWRPGCGRWAAKYDLSNLSGNIKRNRDRLAQLEREQEPDYQERPRLLSPVKYPSPCRVCGVEIERGAMALYFRRAREIACYPECAGPAI